MQLTGCDPSTRNMTGSPTSFLIAKRRVRVWFGDHVIAEYVAEPERAARYAAAMQRRFIGLRVSNEPCPMESGPSPLPAERWWDTAPR